MNVRELVRVHRGPLATVYCCPYCRFHSTVPKVAAFRPGTVGRGYGLAEGSRAQAATVAHIKAEHRLQLLALAAERSAT